MFRPENISKIYRTRSGEVRALDDVSLEIDEGRFVVVQGPSGSGKTTLLLTIGGMLRPTKGRMLIDGTDIYVMSDRDRARFRAERIGFVFQMFHLVPYLTVIENVLLPAAAEKNRVGRRRGRELLDQLGLSEREHHKPAELSVGERQRAAMARALVTDPKLVLADEPTGNLDPDNAAEAMRYLAEFHRGGGTVIVVTHGTAADAYADRVYQLRNGRIDASP